MHAMFSTSGSAGDLLPLVPIAQRLADDGAFVGWTTSRTLGVYLRQMGYPPPFAIGNGLEGRLDPARLLTPRFTGFESWRRLIEQTVLPTLDEDLAACVRAIRRTRPDVVITSGFAVAARVAALRCGVPNVELSIYPQLQELAFRGGRFASPLRLALARLGVPEALVSRTAWGAPADLVLVDPTLVAVPNAIGYPYCEMDGATADLDYFASLLDSSEPTPTVLCTLGSFTSAFTSSRTMALIESAASVNARTVWVGPLSQKAHLACAGSIVCIPRYVPLSKVLPKVDLVVHHGGLGTTMAALSAGVPAVVVPHAFDQRFNAKALERLGVGTTARETDLGTVIRSMLGSNSFRRRAESASRRLTLVSESVARAVETIRAAVP